jgi:RimJ/RimL family protein N-acetyltransferase
MGILNPPDPPLEDGVVTLRGWRTSDAPDITRMFADREALEWTRAPDPYREGDARQWLASLPAQMRRGDALPLAITDARDGSLLGSIELRVQADGRAEFGYMLAAWARGRGVGTRALRLVARYAFDVLHLERLEVLVQPGNEASQALAARVGFEREGVLRAHSVVRGERRDMVMMSLLRGELREET